MRHRALILMVSVFVAYILACFAMAINLRPVDDQPYITTAETKFEELSEPIIPLAEEDVLEVEESSEETFNVVPEEITEATEEPSPAYSYTEEELDLLARLINAESGIESYETKLKVGSVVMNRVESSHFPNTISEVIYQKNQFSVTFIETDGVVMIDQPASEDAKKAAYEVLTYGSVLPPDVQVFYRSDLESGWVTTREPYGTYDRTAFAYIHEREGV